MAADQDRADRIRALKKDHPEYTWQAIADRVGVSLRAAQSWQERGGIEYENAKKLAALWGEDLDYIMRGHRHETPDLMGDFDGGSQLDRIEAVLKQLVADQRSHELAQKALGEALAAVAGELAALRDATPARRRQAS